ncbi:MAG: hypothetical protein ACOYB4_08995 [Methyloceanibacter sp.]
MTKSKTHPRFPRLLIGSTIGTTLVSIAAAWIVTSVYFAPVMTSPEAANAEQSRPYDASKSSRPHFRLSPIPAGADWTA